MIHIVFNSADAEVLQRAISLDDTLSGEILEIKDDYAVGPLTDLYSPEGRALRNEWWKEVLSGGDLDGSVEKGIVNDEAVVDQIRQTLQDEPEQAVWIWAAQNKHDVSGYFWLMSQLAEYQGKIFILYLNNLPFISEKGNIFYPDWIHQIPPKEFLKAKKLARPITPSEFEVDADEWRRIAAELKMVRILEGGKKLTQHNEDFYDADLRKFISAEWQKGSRIISQFLSKNKHTTGDAYLLWRLKKLIETGGYEVQGEIRAMKEFEVKIAGTSKEETAG